MIMSCHISRRHAGAIRGLQLENNRDPDHPRKFVLSDIDYSRTRENVYLTRSDNWMGGIRQALADYGINHYRKNAVLLLDTIYSASKDFFVVNSYETIMDYFQECHKVHASEFGVILNSVIHFDERKPHLHIVSIPIIERESGYALCARDMVGGKQRLYKYHDRLYVDVGKHFDLERGIRSDSQSKKKHMEMYQLKLFGLEDKITFATGELERIKTDIDRFGSIDGLFAWASDIATKVNTIIAALGSTCSIEKIQESIEAHDILLERNIKEAGCNIEETADGKYSYFSDIKHNAVSWDNVVPLYVQDGIRFIPSSWALDGKQMVVWKNEDICREYRDSAECKPIEKLDQISDDLERLINRIEEEKDDVDRDAPDVDIDKDDD